MPQDDPESIKAVEQKTLLEIGSDSSPATASSSQVGGLPAPDGAARLGQVMLLQEVGQGGMGKVYRGHHLGLDKQVAVKVMGQQLAGNAMAKARFLREARTAARLDHPAVVRMLDVNEDGGAPYIVMEFVDGVDLAALLKEHSALDGMAVLRALAQVAEGLAHAHAEGIVHRDIKPHNIFAARDGRVKLGDFGLARAVEQTTELTVAGAALGTSYYMSPEQAEGREVDQRSDIYSLGVTAWHLLTGEPPYTGTTPVSIAVQHVNKDMPYERAKFGHLPDAAVYLLISMTARDAAKRPSAREVSDKLQQVLLQATGNSAARLGRLEDLIPAKGQRRDVVTQTLPVLPPGSLAQPQPMLQPVPMPPRPVTPVPPPITPYPYVPPRQDNTMLWVAIGLGIMLVLMFGGCVMALALS